MRARKEILIGIGLFLLAIIVYYPSLDTGLVADDFHLVERLSFEDALRSLRATVGYSRNEYRPLVASSFALSNTLWHGDPRDYTPAVLSRAQSAGVLWTGLDDRNNGREKYP